jgi:hypothetical protein
MTRRALQYDPYIGGMDVGALKDPIEGKKVETY